MEVGRASKRMHQTHAPPVDSIVDQCLIALCWSIGREYCCLLADSFDHDVGSVRSDGRRRKMCFCYLMLGSCYRACNRTKVPTYVFLDFLCVVKLQKSPFRSRVHLGQATSSRQMCPRLRGYLDCTQRVNANSECITLTRLKASYFLFLHSQIQWLVQWANAKSVKNLGRLTARLDILLSGSLMWTYTWSRYEVPIKTGNRLMMDLGGILMGLAMIFFGEDW